MNGNKIALDTSVAIRILAGQIDSPFIRDPSLQVFIPAPVVGELRFGALNSRRSTENIAAVGQLIARCHVLSITEATAAVYAELRVDLRRKGHPIPENDLWIAAVCVEHNVRLAAVDGHFDAVDRLRREPVS